MRESDSERASEKIVIAWRYLLPSTSEKSAFRKRYRRFKKDFRYLRVVRVETQTEGMEASRDHRVLALVTSVKKPKWLLFTCPCGCGELLRISLSRAIRPTWRIRLGRDGKVSLYPSIDRDSGCRAHFFLISNVARLL